MRELTMPPIVFILIEDETALYQIGEERVFEIAVKQAQFSNFKPKVKILCPTNLYRDNKLLAKTDYELLTYEKIGDFLKDLNFESEIVIFHNASRPLVPKKIYNQGVTMLLQGVDAVKQQHVVIDTLKRIDVNNIVHETVDRDLVKAITSPEFYWVESILRPSEQFGWFYQIKNENNKKYISGELESTRIRSERDLFLVKALIEQGRLY